MEDLRSKSYSNERSMEVGNTYTNYSSTHFNDNNNKTNSTPKGMQDLRCYSASYASSSSQNNNQLDIVVSAAAGSGGEQWKFKKGKSTNGGSVSKSWSFSDPEVQRKKRVASYKAYTVEGKVKGSFKKSLRWIKQRYTLMVYGYR